MDEATLLPLALDDLAEVTDHCVSEVVFSQAAHCVLGVLLKVVVFIDVLFKEVGCRLSDVVL